MFMRAHASANGSAATYGDFVIYKDGRAFLIVNASAQRAEEVLQSFRQQSSAIFTMESKGR